MIIGVTRSTTRLFHCIEAYLMQVIAETYWTSLILGGFASRLWPSQQQYQLHCRGIPDMRSVINTRPFGSLTAVNALRCNMMRWRDTCALSIVDAERQDTKWDQKQNRNGNTLSNFEEDKSTVLSHVQYTEWMTAEYHDSIDVVSRNGIRKPGRPRICQEVLEWHTGGRLARYWDNVGRLW